MLTDNQILKLINDDALKVTPEPTEKQFQPTSLDWRIGAVEIFDKDTIDKNQREYLRRFSEAPENDEDYDYFTIYIDDFLDSLECDVKYLDKDDSFILEPGQQAIIYSREQFNIPDWLSMYSELRSSNGRLGLSPIDGRIQDLSYEGRVKMSVVNKNPNPLKFYGGGQVRSVVF